MGIRTDIPKYRRIGEKLLEEINSGKFSTDERLPGELKIAKRFGVSRVTARQALIYLEQEGLVSRQQGAGTYVQAVDKDEAEKAAECGQIVFVLVDVSDKIDYNFAELVTMERYLTQRGVPFSWVVLKSENIAKGEFPAILEKKLCDGVLLDGHVQDAHYALIRQFSKNVVVVGNHNVSPQVPQVRYGVRETVRKICGVLGSLPPNPRPIAMLVEPFKLHITHELYEGYHEALQALPQRSELVYFCVDDDGTRVEQVFAHLKEPFCLITTDKSVPRVLDTYQRLGVSPKEYPIAVVGSINRLREIEDQEGVYRMLINPGTIALRATQHLIRMIETGEENVYEELGGEIVMPRR